MSPIRTKILNTSNESDMNTEMKKSIPQMIIMWSLTQYLCPRFSVLNKSKIFDQLFRQLPTVTVSNFSASDQVWRINFLLNFYSII